MWNVYEFPDDLKTFSENELITRNAFAKFFSRWSFYLLPRHPEEINREALVNMLNGIYIDTERLGGEELKSRYYILEPKSK